MKNGSHIIFYDGICGLCNSFVQFVLRYASNAPFLFCSLQSNKAKELLAPYGENSNNLNTVFVLTDYGLPSSKLLKKSKAIFFILKQCELPWCWLNIFAFLPDFILNFGYDLVARVRYKIFGRYKACPIPEPNIKDKFID